MSWIQSLYDTYDNCQTMIGISSNEKEVPLLPICHTTQKAQIEIAIDLNGNFKRAKVVPKNESRTIIPCTESSGGRSGKKPDCHPLCDKLQYIARDYIDYGGKVTSGYAKNPKEPYEKYKELLKKWCESEHSHSKVQAVLKYIEKGNVIKDLIDNQVLVIDNNAKLLEKWDKKIMGNDIPDIFKVSANSTQMDAFVRWVVEIPNNSQSEVWSDANLFKKWIKYYSSIKKSKEICYISGKQLCIAEQHPAKIRNDGDKAKLISSNDNSGFTFRGRFLTSVQACSVGFESTQKAHNVLRWLISRQGYRRSEQTIVAWATSGEKIPDLMADAYSILELDKIQSDSENCVSTAQQLALKLNKKIAGYSVELGNTINIVVMGLDSATPGRMSITYYRELTGSDFLDRLENWHKTCCWIHDYRWKEVINAKDKKGKIHIRFVGAPAPSDIAEAAYSSKIDDKLRKATVERILSCIIDKQKIPRDLSETVVRRASNRTGMEDWEWNKTLSIACAFYRKYKKDYEKEDIDMALDENRKTRDYLYGRLLALADSLEKWALNKSGEGRQTNAARLMQRFAEHPYTTWRNIELALEPYKARLGNISTKRQNLITEVTAMFETNDYMNDKKLSGEFLLGYHCQREALWDKEDKDSIK